MLPRAVYTCGYEKMTPAELKKLVQDLDVTLLDVRSRPSGRVQRRFSKADLTKLLGKRYEWGGADLGGLGDGPTSEGLARLADDPRQLLLLCKEHSPGDCHRHQIALDLVGRGVPVLHVFEDEAIEPLDLQKAIDDDTEYECYDLADVIAEASKV